MEEESESMSKYFREIESSLKKAYSRATEARGKGLDPEETVDLPLTKNMAERVEGLVSIAAPALSNSGVSKRIQQLEKKYGALSWQVALIIAEEVAKEKFCKFGSQREAMEAGIRTGFAYHTTGVVAAPLEGFIELKIKKRQDGRDYLAASFAGPIRGAGGTAIGVCLLITDYIRTKMGYPEYDPTEEEINRFITELEDYHERITNLQYKPSAEETRLLIESLPVEVDGDPTETVEVSNYKDLPRVETNRLRSGVCLVVSSLALKAQKMRKSISSLGEEFGIKWDFLDRFLKLQKKKKSMGGATTQKISPDFTYISDLVAGRPVLSYPLNSGGLRLRYGRSRMSGYSAAAIHPATMVVLDKYIAIGTQLKVERPGKAAAITPCENLDGPVVRLKSGAVIKIEAESSAKQYAPEIEEILYLGDILISYGDFYDRGHILVPAGYCEEWYVQDLERAAVNIFGSLDVEKLAEHLSAPADHVDAFIKNPFLTTVTASSAIKISEKLRIPLHPKYTYYWNSITPSQLVALREWLSKGEVKGEGGKKKLVLPFKSEPKRALEVAGIPHAAVSKEFVVISQNEMEILTACLALNEKKDFTPAPEDTSLEIVNLLSPVKVADKCGTFIGARMGRPEKAKMRHLTGSPQVLFPVGDEGGRLRSFNAAVEEGKVIADFPIYYCQKCSKETIYPLCETCSRKTKRRYFCDQCGVIEKEECRHGKAALFMKRPIKIKDYFEAALKTLGMKTFPDLIKGVRGTSNKDHTPENLVKGLLRAKHDIFVNKDGTTRYDMSELPITHFKASEIGTSIEKLKALGYETDYKGRQLETEDQLLEIKPQDVILPASPESPDERADDVLFRIANFVDDLLTGFYRLKPFYRLKDKSELAGSLVIGIAPHISAGIVGRIIGFSQTQAFLAHPLFHAAMRRDADGDEACVMLLMDALLNFSRQYLPDSRGAKTMDSPLVLIPKVVPAEVDDMAHRFDVVWHYPPEFYEAAADYKLPYEVNIELLGSRLGTPAQYEKIGFTHELGNINQGVLLSAYKKLPSMEEKMRGQMELAKRIRAVDATDVASLVIEKHLLKDIKGNLRKFSTQQFRCVKCNKKFRRPPLKGSCDVCGGKLIFTVSEGTIIKYLGPAMSLAESYAVSPYLQQTLLLTRNRVEEVFGKEKDKQEGLGRWFSG
ncbi:DNA polymerase II large subunit [Candidatus Woesearchaeota archaeon]|nr:DNA polymerase II large subunit [Candidatus Woesearchaeota archaeon]